VLAKQRKRVQRKRFGNLFLMLGTHFSGYVVLGIYLGKNSEIAFFLDILLACLHVRPHLLSPFHHVADASLLA
jgi:hypothetical protein